ncbi:carboxylesterase family protein [Streptomyces nitrosporeus]|uniref:carboxylesterase family protein n=1 Tax=Streptomyces nitrosporeus TaxID=28894 RepID=UPI00331DEDF9
MTPGAPAAPLHGGPFRSGPLRYAVAERFARPRPVAGGGARPPAGHICPQPPSRLDAVMGPPLDHRPQGEDCLHLSVTTPARDDGRRPVLVWLHGGGFSSGAGLMDWYDGTALATEGDVVVVSVNYRLGALGYLCLDGVGEDNPGLYDQLEALRWVRDNIASYGGDPGLVTVFGQSAGALSALTLSRMPEAAGLFRRLVLQSAPLEIASRPRAEAAALGRVFADRLAAHAGPSGRADPRTAAPADLLAAQRDTAAVNRERSGSVLEPPFGPVDGAYPPGEEDAHVQGLDIMYGWNADEMTAFPGGHGGPDRSKELTRTVFAEPLTALGKRLVRAGARVHAYRLDWRPAGSPYGATHCVELPLLLGTRYAWRRSPMLGSASWDEVDTLGRAVRAVWTAFARTGTPGPAPAPLKCHEVGAPGRP